MLSDLMFYFHLHILFPQISIYIFPLIFKSHLDNTELNISLLENHTFFVSMLFLGAFITILKD